MPRFTSKPLFASGTLRLSRVCCDGCDGPHPATEHVPSDRLVVLLRGSFEFRDREARTVADPASALVMRRDTEFTVRHPRGEGDVSLNMVGGVVGRLIEARGACDAVEASGYARLHGLARELESEPDAELLHVEEVLCSALAPPAVGRAESPRRERALAEELAHEVRLRFDEQVPLEELAEKVGISVFRACRVFRRTIGTSIHQYQQEIRLRHALALLWETGWPLSRLALEAGFANQGHFTNRFRRRFGVTPGQARRPEGQRWLAGQGGGAEASRVRG